VTAMAEPRVWLDKVKVFNNVGYVPHEKQWLYHNSTARYRIPVCGRRFGKSRMAAMDLLPELFLHDRRYWIVGPCVDVRTEILTQRGWLRHTEIQDGDLTLTLNTRGLAQWQPIQDVARYYGVHEMTKIVQRGHDSMTTANHRWLVGYTGSVDGGKGRAVKGYRFTDTEHMTKSNEFVLGGAPVLNLPVERKYEDALVELVGWYWTEGTDQASGTGTLITQNAGPHADRVRAALTTVFGQPSTTSQMRNRYDDTPRWSDWKPIPGQPSCGRFGLNSRAGRVVREHAPDKVVAPEFITALTHSQLELLIETSVRADGHERVRPNGARERVVVQDRHDRLSAIQMAAQLAGYQTTLLEDRSQGRWRLTIFERTRMFLGQKSAVEKRAYQPYVGTVWCPRTENGTWLARRNGTVYFTGNTYDLGEREFRVIWDTLHRMRVFGAGVGVKGVYNRSAGRMEIRFPWNTLLQVRSADHPENLVGDSLHGVIMSEAAKQNEQTWSQYIRPALTDHRGWATFPTTPEGTANWVYDLWRRGQNPEYPEYESWRFPSWVNPHVYPLGEHDPEIQSIRRETATPIFLQEYGASFSAFVGQIYPEFDETVHVKPIQFNPDWPNYIAWDFGFANPLAAIEFQVDPFDRVWVWREHYAAAMTIDQHVEYMKSRPQPHGYRIDMMFGDSADPEAIETLNQIMAPCVGDPQAKSNWREGVSVVKRFFLPRDEKAPAGTPGAEPSIWIDNTCENVIREHLNYRIIASRGDVDPREAAKRSSDHTCDALRYGLMHVFHLGYRSGGPTTELLRGLTSSRESAAVPSLGVGSVAEHDTPRSVAVTTEGLRF
jgi:hypothetical protein